MTRSQKPIEIVQPPNTLKAKFGASASVDLSALKRAEAALSKIKTEFSDWIAAETEKLVACKNQFVNSKTAASRDELFRASLDLKSQALAFDYPTVARVAASLCRLLEGAGDDAEPGLVGAHVDTIRVLVRDEVRIAQDGVAAQLAAELEDRVRGALGRA
jgi:hypothetical protein